MNDTKYIGLDVHQATISSVVLDSAGKLVMEGILEMKAATILQFVHGLRGSLQVTFEEGTCAAWLHDLLQPHVSNVLVCDPRKNALLKAGNKNDRIGTLSMHVNQLMRPPSFLCAVNPRRWEFGASCSRAHGGASAPSRWGPTHDTQPAVS